MNGCIVGVDDELLNLISPEEAANVVRLEIILPADVPDVPQKIMFPLAMYHGSPATRYMVLICFYIWLQKEYLPGKLHLRGADKTICRIVVRGAGEDHITAIKSLFLRAHWQCARCTHCEEYCGGDPYIRRDTRHYIFVCCRCNQLRFYKLGALPIEMQKFMTRVLPDFTDDYALPAPLSPPRQALDPPKLANPKPLPPTDGALLAAAQAAAQRLLSFEHKTVANGLLTPSAPSPPPERPSAARGDQKAFYDRKSVVIFDQKNFYDRKTTVVSTTSSNSDSAAFWERVHCHNSYFGKSWGRDSFYEWKIPKTPLHLREPQKQIPSASETHEPLWQVDSIPLTPLLCGVWGCKRPPSKSIYEVYDVALRITHHLRAIPHQQQLVENLDYRFCVRLAECGECEGFCSHFDQSSCWCPPPTTTKPIPPPPPPLWLTNPLSNPSSNPSSGSGSMASSGESKTASMEWFWENLRLELILIEETRMDEKEEQSLAIQLAVERARQVWNSTMQQSPWKPRIQTIFAMNGFLRCIQHAAKPHQNFMGESQALVKSLHQILIPMLPLLHEFCFWTISQKLSSLQVLADCAIRLGREPRAMFGELIETLSSHGIITVEHAELWENFDEHISTWRAENLRTQVVTWLKNHMRPINMDLLKLFQPGLYLSPPSSSALSMLDFAIAQQTDTCLPNDDDSGRGGPEPPESPPPPLDYDSDLYTLKPRKSKRPPSEEKNLSLDTREKKPKYDHQFILQEESSDSGSEKIDENIDSPEDNQMSSPPNKKRRTVSPYTDDSQDSGEGEDEENDGLSPYTRMRYAKRLVMNQDPDSEDSDPDSPHH